MSTETVICTYRVKADAEQQFVELLSRHWSTLHELGFVTGEESRVFRSVESPPTYVEIFTWVEGGFGQAHEHPDVLSLWDGMGILLEDRDGQPKWDFPHYRPVTLGA